VEKTDQFVLLTNWLSTFDLNLLQNEDDVETKFILPFFRYLGYADAYRRGKYPIDIYQPGKGKRGRKPEIDQIYFSENDITKQNPSTSLLLVEAKEPQDSNLEEAIKQAKFYGNHLTPLAFDEGSCSIEFSSIMLRGLTCHLSHSDILNNFLKGLGTNPRWNTRPFLQQNKQGTFEATLGQTTVILSEKEADELCQSIDIVFQRYKDIIIEAANNLETWDFFLKKIDNEVCFELLSVKRWLWDLMKEFSEEFDYDNGNTIWHTFESSVTYIRVSHKKEPDHAIIWPASSKFGIDIFYQDSISFIYRHAHRYSSAEPLFEQLGPLGIWSAIYTRNWLVQRFIPQVLWYYLKSASSLSRVSKELLKQLPSNILTFRQRGMSPTLEQLNVIMQDAVSDIAIQKTPIADITECKQFSPYVHLVQSTFVSHRENISASIIRPYYKAFTELAKCADHSSIERLGYILGKLSGVQSKQQRQGLSRKNLVTYKDVLNYLDKQVLRIHEVDYEVSDNIDLISRVFATIVEDGTFNFDQKKLNAAKKGLIPLWEYCRFEGDFIEPIIFGY
jgi:hypothetical protein